MICAFFRLQFASAFHKFRDTNPMLMSTWRSIEGVAANLGRVLSWRRLCGEGAAATRARAPFCHGGCRAVAPRRGGGAAKGKRPDAGGRRGSRPGGAESRAPTKQNTHGGPWAGGGPQGLGWMICKKKMISRWKGRAFKCKIHTSLSLAIRLASRGLDS